MSFKLRVLCWNIDEGRALDSVVEQICSKSPDIVLLNEIKSQRWPWGIDQTAVLSEKTGLRYYKFGKTTALGITGDKGVSILSRYPLGTTYMHPVMRGSTATTYGTLEAAVIINNVGHQLFSTRFDAYNLSDNIAGHQQAIDMIQGINSRIPIYIGGDFNAQPDSPQMQNFVAHSGLTDAFLKLPDPLICGPESRIDHIFFRSPYTLTTMEQRCPWAGQNEASDHPWVFIELSGQEPNLLRDGGVFYTDDPADQIMVTVEQNTVAADSVEFVLRSSSNITWQKEIIIRESSSVGQGAWTIFTKDNKHEDRNGLYTYQLAGGSLVFRKAKFLGMVTDVKVIQDISTAQPGSRIIFTWNRD